MFHHAFCRKQWDNSKPYIFLSDIPKIIWNILCSDIALSYMICCIFLLWISVIPSMEFNKDSSLSPLTIFSFNSYFWPLKWVQCHEDNIFSKLPTFSLFIFSFHSGWLYTHIISDIAKQLHLQFNSLKGNVIEIVKRQTFWISQFAFEF